MPLIHDTIDLPVDDGTMTVVTYRPDDGHPHPAIIVSHDAYGLREGILTIAERFASEGYFVAAPDAYHHVGSMKTVPRGAPREEQLALREGMTNDGHAADIAHLVAYLRGLDATTDRVGITGFCLGGRITYLAAAYQTGVDAAVAFYMTRVWQEDPAIPGSPAPIARAKDVACPFLSFYPALDNQNPPERIEEIAQAIKASSAGYQPVVYPEADHGFFQSDSPAYSPTRATEAWEQTKAFFTKHLAS